MAIKFSLPLSRLIARPARKPDAPKPSSRLLACAECGLGVSPQATICPHCNLPPRRKRCAICCKDDKQSALVNYAQATAVARGVGGPSAAGGGVSSAARSMPNSGGGLAGARGSSRYERYSRARGGNRIVVQTVPAPPLLAIEGTVPTAQTAPESEPVLTDDGLPIEIVSADNPLQESAPIGSPEATIFSPARSASTAPVPGTPTAATGVSRVGGGTANAFAHQRCLNAVQNTPQRYACPDCGLVRSLLLKDGFPSCPGCGKGVPRANCRSCGQPLLRTPAFRFAFFTLRGNERIEGFFHPQCSAGIEKRGEELMRRRRERKRCVLCGGDLGFMRGLFSDRHVDCDVLRYESREPWRVE